MQALDKMLSTSEPPGHPTSPQTINFKAFPSDPTQPKQPPVPF